MTAYLREHALMLILIVVVAAVGVGIITKQDGPSTGGAKAPVECSIDGNFNNDPPGCVNPAGKP